MAFLKVTDAFLNGCRLFVTVAGGLSSIGMYLFVMLCGVV